MTLNLNVPKIQSNLTPRITVIGVGGAGGNAVNNMIQSNLEGVDFRIANTDAQAIQQSLCEDCIQLGRGITQGLGAGSRPDIGRAAAEEALDDILTELDGANMVFITAGMGGGTGTGGAPVIARAAREAGILTVGVVTKPFHFEGVHRMRLAEGGITELTQYVDTLIVIPNQNLFRIANEKTTFSDAFKMADDVLHAGVRGVTDLMVMPGLINLDFADIRAVMTEMGKAMMGTGEGEGENRAIAAAEAAISNPLLDEVSMKGARGVLINITGGPDLTLFEVDETANRIRDEVDPEANIIFGSTFDQSMEGHMRVSVVATGIDAESAIQPRPVTLSLVTTGPTQQRAGGAGGPTAMSEATVQTTAELTAAPAETVMQAEVASEPMMAQAVGGNSLYAYSQATVSQAAVQTATAQVIEETLVAAPEAVAEDNFIAPLPVEPEVAPEPDIRIEPEMAPDPFASAAMENASRAPRGPDSARTPNFDRKKAQGLFAKMAGGATRALQAAQSGEQRVPTPAAMTSTAAPTATPAAEPKLEPAGATQPAPAQPAASQPATSQPIAPQSTPGAQPRLSGVDRNTHSGLSQTEEDLLDIPAFLRRQAN